MHPFHFALRRRSVLGLASRLAGVAAAAGLFGAGLALPFPAASAVGKPEPEEKIDTTLKRLFGDRKIQDGASLMKLDTQLIAENGSLVPVKLEINVDPTPQKYVKAVYFIADKNRRPMSAKFNFSPALGRPTVETNVRLGETTHFRAIAEMSDGSLFEVKNEIKVTVGGCGG
ncbi:MAG: thiosulfate oxidation carrier protein SoxY [Acidimicrobiia bacterium]|nr:thiosulfate oxidation carrier protein SoxY [Acidimicrobiia bacterium]